MLARKDFGFSPEDAKEQCNAGIPKSQALENSIAIKAEEQDNPHNARKWLIFQPLRAFFCL